MSAAEPVFSVRGVRKLAVESSDWTGARFIEWVASGFDCLADRTRENEWPLAFAPLVFRADSSIIGQLAAALTESRRAGYAWPGNLRAAIVEHLDGIELADDADLTRALDLWRCLGALGLIEIDIVLARKLIQRLTPELAGRCTDRVRPLVTALATSVAAIPAEASNLGRFFLFLRGRPHLWEDRLIVPLVDTQLRVGGDALDENWNHLRQNFGEILRQVANPKTPAGRALTRTLAQRLCPGWDGGADASIETLQGVLDRIDVQSVPRSNLGEVEVTLSRRPSDALLQLASGDD